MLDGFRDETDRAVLSAITERLYWVNTHLLEEEARPAFEHFVVELYGPQLERLGWDASEGNSADDRLRRATVIAALGELTSSAAIQREAENRLESYLRDRSTLDPNLASVVVGLGARHGDDARYERYIAEKRAAAKDPEEEHRFLFALAAFEDPALVRRTLGLLLTDEIRPQDRPHLLARLLGARAARLAAWSFVRDRWTDLTAAMDPMLQQNVIRGLIQLTPEPTASEVRSFLSSRATDETRETIAQTLEQLSIDAAACARRRAEVTTALNALIQVGRDAALAP